MNKRVIQLALGAAALVALLALSLSPTLAVPAPPSLVTTKGTVQKDYVDKTNLKRLYVTIVKPDGTTQELWSDKRETKELIRAAADAHRQLTLQHVEVEGEVFSASSDY